MAGTKTLFFFIVCAMASVLDGQTLGGPMHDKVVVCYVASWAVYRVNDGMFLLDDLEPALCTHLVYSFAGLDEEKMSIKSLDPWQDLEINYGKAGYKRLVGLKDRYPHLKVTIAIGGWNEGSVKYSRMAATAENRKKFVDSVMVFLNQYKFDGLDLDWEYPARRDGSPVDKANYVLLAKELSEAFKPRGYILTAALGAGKETMDAAYDLPKLSKYLDLIHMMCYDYHGTWEGRVGANAPLRGTSEDDVLSVEYTVNYMLSHGVSPYKLVMGLPMYGRTFILTEPSVRDIEFGRTKVQASGFKGPFTGEAGFMGYNEICAEVSNKSSKWTHHWHDQSATPYLRDGERVITYDNARSIAIKVRAAINYGLGGLMVWSIDTDDFRGACDHESDAYVDFVERYNSIQNDLVLKEALKTLNLPDTKRLSKRSSYSVSNGRLNLQLPVPQYSNYAIMETINTAAMLSVEEKRILDEMDRITKENVIDKNDDKPGSSASVSGSILGVVFCVLMVFRLEN